MKRSERGFTLIELMVALLVSTLLVIMLLSIFARVSFAYREQQKVVELSQLLAAARNALEHDARQAGYQLAQGFKLAIDGGVTKRSPVRVVNNADAADELGFYYADASVQALVTSASDATSVSVDDASEFAVGDLVVLTTPDVLNTVNPIDPSNDAKLVTFDACVLKIAQVDATSLTFDEVAPWGDSGNTHCTSTQANKSMVFKFVAHYWRIDATRPDLAPLQLDNEGHLVGASAFTDQAYNIADLQVATYFYDGDGADTDDPDTDADRDWASAELQETNTDDIAVASSFVPPLMMSMSVVARTEPNVEGIYTRQSPELLDSANVDNNTLGDRESMTLPSTGLYSGLRIYRYITFQVDLRNIGVGR